MGSGAEAPEEIGLGLKPQKKSVWGFSPSKKRRDMIYALIGFGILTLLAVMIVSVVKSLTVICGPNEVLVFSGGSQGTRLVHGGRSMRVPLLEQVDTLDLTNMVIDLRVGGAYSKGGIPLDVQGVANVKVASEEPTIHNAIERFLGVPRTQLIKVAKETLEGNLRGVLATLTPEEINEDRVKFAQSLLHEGEMDLQRLGLSLDMLKIQHVSDEVGYLDSLGRKQSADLQMRSRVAEAQNKAVAAVRNAENMEAAELARIKARLATAKAEARRAARDAVTQREAVVAESRGVVTAEVARAYGDIEVHKARVEQVRSQLIADTLRPAEAERDRGLAHARAAAASIVEEGRATASSIREMAAVWEAHGEEARQVLLAQKLEGLVERMLSTVGKVGVDKLTVVGGGGDNLAGKARLASDGLKHAVGVDLPALVQKLAG